MDMLLIHPQHVAQFLENGTDNIFGDYVLLPHIGCTLKYILFACHFVVLILICVDIFEVFFPVLRHLVCVHFVLPVDHLFFFEQSTGVNFINRLHEFMQVIVVDDNFFQQLLLFVKFFVTHCPILVKVPCKLGLFQLVFLLCVG